MWEASRSRKNVGMTRNGSIIVERVFRAHGGQPENSRALRRRIWLAVCGRCLSELGIRESVIDPPSQQ